jgi:excisionase family DNA binding protein
LATTRAARRHPETPEIEPKLYSMAGASASLGISRKYLYDLVREGNIRTLQLGRRRLIAADELDRFVEVLKDRAAE